MTEDINGFFGANHFLSNFHDSPIQITYAGEMFVMPTGEHAFHAAKVGCMLSEDPEERLAFVRRMAACPTPNAAKYAGKSVKIDPKRWDAMSYRCMDRVQRLKFEQNPDLRAQLIATGDVRLVESNTWGDRLWGQVNGVGKNQLGEILMSLRSELSRA